MKLRLTHVLFILNFLAFGVLYGQEKSVTHRVIAELSANKYQVTLYLENTGSEGFMRIMELYPANFHISNIEAENALVTILSSGVKFLWTDNQKRPEFIQYYLVDQNNSGKPTILGDCIAGKDRIETQYITESTYSESIQAKKQVVALPVSGTITDAKTGERSALTANIVFKSIVAAY